MTIKKLVAFGDSWTFGDELVDPHLAEIEAENLKKFGQIKDHYDANAPYRLDHCYAGLVAKHYGLELNNMAFPGSSLESMRWNLMWYLKGGMPKDVLFVVGLTDATRMSWFNPNHHIAKKDPPWNRHMHGTWLTQPNPDIDDNWFALQRTWMGMSYHRDWAEFNFAQTINLFDQAQSRYGIPVVQFNVLTNDYASNCPTLIYPGTDFRGILNSRQKEFGKTYFAPGGHPNEQGHQIIADHLIEHIKYSKILEC